MFSFSWTPLLVMLSILMGLALTVLLSVLKLLGYLLISWWWIAAPVPALLVVIVFIAAFSRLAE